MASAAYVDAMKTNTSARKIWKWKMAGIAFLFLSLTVVSLELSQSLAEVLNAKISPAQAALHPPVSSISLGDVFSCASH
jgi:hypothetical protein